MTSYPFLKMAVATAKLRFRISYFGFVCWCHSLQKFKLYQQTKFCWHNLNWLMSCNYFRFFLNKRPPYWNYTSGCDLDYLAVIGVLFCIRLPNFVQIGTSTAKIWHHIDFQDGGRRPCCICFGVMADHPRSAFHGLNSVLKSLVCRSNSSGDIAMSRFWRFGLKLPIYAPFWKFWGIFSPCDVTHRRDPQKDRP